MWLTILLAILGPFIQPAIAALVAEIVALIKRRHPNDQTGLRSDLTAAVNHYKVSRDARPLRALRDRLYASLDAIPKS